MNALRPSVCIHWFRRDLRLEDNHALFRALSEQGRVLPLFIFDTGILDRLEDRRGPAGGPHPSSSPGT